MESSQKWDLPFFEAFLSNAEIKGLPGANKKKNMAPDPKGKRKIFFLLVIYYTIFGEKSNKMPTF